MKHSRYAVLALALTFGVAASPPQSIQLGNVMREKLAHAQRILEAVVTSNWVALETQSRELQQLTADPRWTVLKYPEYAQHSSAFIRSIEALHTAAAQRDEVKTAPAYIDMTLQCVACHRYLARQRLAIR